VSDGRNIRKNYKYALSDLNDLPSADPFIIPTTCVGGGDIRRLAGGGGGGGRCGAAGPDATLFRNGECPAEGGGGGGGGGAPMP
jgi:hypothetical protein